MDDIHPLIQLVRYYCENFPLVKREHEELDNLSFHRQYGLSIGIPSDWPYVETINETLQAFETLSTASSRKYVIIYSSSSMYSQISSALAVPPKMADISYHAWQEIYVAMDRASKDTREIKRFSLLLSAADVVFFCGAPSSIPEVLDQVRGFCEGCLVIFS